MRQYADILAFDKNGQLALVVEVKNKRGTSSDWAAEMRRNLFAHGLLPNAPYFLLALPDTFYLWKNTDNTSDAVAPYFGSSDMTSNDLTGTSFDLIVTSWLNQVIRAQNTQELVNENQDWLISSGLYNQLAGGHLALEAVA
jgi:hypothetical protein